jgi:hypothetical protein
MVFYLRKQSAALAYSIFFQPRAVRSPLPVKKKKLRRCSGIPVGTANPFGV